MRILFTAIIVSLLFTSCATQYQKDLWHNQDVYHQECSKWYKSKGHKMTLRKAGEESLPVQDVIAARCKEDPSVCTPPRKHPKLLELEKSWNQPEIEDYCASKYEGN